MILKSWLYLPSVMVAVLFVISYTFYRDLNFSRYDYSICPAYDEIRCQNGGLVEQTDNGFACKCTQDFEGVLCTDAKPATSTAGLFGWLRRVTGSAFGDDEDLTGIRWSLLTFTPDRRLIHIYTFHQNQMNILSANMWSDVVGRRNRNSMSTRILSPARPLHCVTNKHFPSLNALYKGVFQRYRYTPDPRGRNLLFHTFYQYFVLQFLNSDFDSSVSASQLYGADGVSQRELRSFCGGKLKTEFVNDEHYPPLLSSAKEIQMVYPHVKQTLNSEWFNRILMYSNRFREQNLRWAMGHPLLSMTPMLFAMSTLWVREHNRVCDVLALEWPSWTDDRIYKTAKKIVTGEMMEIMMNDVINVHVNGRESLKLKPEIYDDRFRNTSNFKTPLEILLTTMWPSSLPEKFWDTPVESILFSNNSQVFENGMSDMIKSMVEQKMSMVTHNNDGTATRPLTRLMIKLSRENAVQSFNNYRRRLGLRAYEGFSEMTGNSKTAYQLQTLYGNVEDVELLPGMLTEKKDDGNSPTAAALANSFIVNSILTNLLTSKTFWTPDTFGGHVGFDIVKSADIESLICNNLANNCDGFRVKLYAE